jgi:hypothetical protein
MLHNSTAKQTKPLLLKVSESLMTWPTQLTKWKPKLFHSIFLKSNETKAFTLLYSAFDVFSVFGTMPHLSVSTPHYCLSWTPSSHHQYHHPLLMMLSHYFRKVLLLLLKYYDV